MGRLDTTAIRTLKGLLVLDSLPSDALAAVIWLFVTGSRWLFSTVSSRRLAPEASNSVTAIHALTIGLSILVAWAFILSSLKLLTGSAWLLAVFATSLCGLWYLHDRGALLSPVNGGVITPTLPSRVETRIWHRLWGFLAALFAAHVVLDGLLRIPTDFDCLLYHLPLLDEWLQARCLYNPESSYNWTPGNSELIGLWMVSPFSGDFLQALNNVPIVALWGVATWQLSRELGVSRTWAHLATLAVFAVYTTLHETDDASNDLAVVAFAAAAMYYALASLRHEKLYLIVGCGLQLGLLAGVKYFGLGYAGLIGGVLVVLVVSRRGLWRGVVVAGWLCNCSRRRHAWVPGAGPDTVGSDVLTSAETLTVSPTSPSPACLTNAFSKSMPNCSKPANNSRSNSSIRRPSFPDCRTRSIDVSKQSWDLRKSRSEVIIFLDLLVLGETFLCQ